MSGAQASQWAMQILTEILHFCPSDENYDLKNFLWLTLEGSYSRILRVLPRTCVLFLILLISYYTSGVAVWKRKNGRVAVGGPEMDLWERAVVSRRNGHPSACFDG